MEAGGEYTFHVDPDEHWYDSTINCDYRGWSLNDKEVEETFGFLKKWFIRAKRNNRIHPEARWFELCAFIGSENNSPPIRIPEYAAEERIFHSDKTGEFLPFANDLKSMYHNNIGYIDVTVTRIS